MGAKLAEYYEKANGIGGMKAKMRLAIMTKIPSAKAVSEAETPELLQKFENALQEIKKEFK